MANSIVMKFGGTSVGDANAIERVAVIVRGRLPQRPVVVVSALARVNHPYPTQAQAIKMAADAYLATRHTPTRKWLQKLWLSR